MKPRQFVSIALLLPMMAVAAPVGYKDYEQPQPAAEFRLSDQYGIWHSPADYRGKVLVLNFWASWCRPCVSEMPALQHAWEILKPDNVQIVGIAVGEQAGDIQLFLQNQKIGFPLLADTDSSVTGKWRVPGLPTTFIIDKRGLVVTRVIGPYEWDSLQSLQYLRTLLHDQ